MNAENTKFKSVKMAWDSITFPLLQGTPIGADGTIQDDEDAIGLVMTTLTEKPLLPNIDILIAGDIEAREIVYNSPTGLSDDAYSAMPNVWIYNSDGTVKKKISSGSGDTFTVRFINADYQVTCDNVFPVPEGGTWGDFLDSQDNPFWYYSAEDPIRCYQMRLEGIQHMENYYLLDENEEYINEETVIEPDSVFTVTISNE